MKPFLEKLPPHSDTSWTMLNRRLDDAIPFQWHHHPEFELTLTLNSSICRLQKQTLFHATITVTSGGTGTFTFVETVDPVVIG